MSHVICLCKDNYLKIIYRCFRVALVLRQFCVSRFQPVVSGIEIGIREVHGVTCTVQIDRRKIGYKDEGGKIENRSRRRFTDIRRWLEEEAESGRMRARDGKRGPRVKGKGREGETASPPDEPPEKRWRWEY